MKALGWPLAMVAIVGIAGIVALLLMALYKGIDGILLSGGIGAIGVIVGGLGGWRIGRSKT